MKIKASIVVLALFAIVVSMAGCGGSGGTKPVPPEPEYTVALNIHTANLIEGLCPQITLIAETDPAGGEVTWTSTDETVAVVSDGVVTAVGEGSCNIKASCGKGSDKCRIKVKAGSSIKVFSGTKTFDYTDKTAVVTASDELDDPDYILLKDETTGKTAAREADPYFIQNVNDGTICFADIEEGGVIAAKGVAFGSELFDGLVHSYDGVWSSSSYTAKLDGSGMVMLDDVAYPAVRVKYVWRIDGASQSEYMYWLPDFGWYAGNEDITLIGVE
ncbi:MAG: Ig-like domain-containing protein [Abditibacteriota bacterium]|nr:Ig-like domain-containing protein [Abditibacteriota bacterium]